MSQLSFRHPKCGVCGLVVDSIGQRPDAERCQQTFTVRCQHMAYHASVQSSHEPGENVERVTIADNALAAMGVTNLAWPSDTAFSNGDGQETVLNASAFVAGVYKVEMSIAKPVTKELIEKRRTRNMPPTVTTPQQPSVDGLLRALDMTAKRSKERAGKPLIRTEERMASLLRPLDVIGGPIRSVTATGGRSILDKGRSGVVLTVRNEANGPTTVRFRRSHDDEYLTVQLDRSALVNVVDSTDDNVRAPDSKESPF